jgi:hypothetical protein
LLQNRSWIFVDLGGQLQRMNFFRQELTSQTVTASINGLDERDPRVAW